MPWVIGGVVAVVLVAVVAPFVYTRFLNDDQPAPLSLSSTPTTKAATGTTRAGSTGTTAAGSSASGSSSDSIDGTWTVASGSQAGYRVQETLFGQSTEGVGRTDQITGTVVIAGEQVTSATFTVDMASVTSDKSQRDNQFNGRIMETSTFPTATFELTEPIDLSGAPTDGSIAEFTATGELTLHGTTKTVSIPLQAKLDGGTISLSGSTTITFADYGIDNPTGGPAQVGDTGTLELLVNLTKS